MKISSLLTKNINSTSNRTTDHQTEDNLKTIANSSAKSKKSISFWPKRKSRKFF